MKTELSHRRHRARPRRPGQPASPALRAAAQPDRAARAAERPRAALDAGHGEGSEDRPQHGDRRLRPAGAGRLSGDAAAHAAAGHGPAERRRTARRRRSTDRQCRSRRAGRSCSTQPYHHGRPGMLAFHPGMPDPDNFPFNTWSKLLSRRAKLAHLDLFGTYHVKGYPPLCEAIARYLTASRGVSCEAEQIVVTNGAQSAFDLLARILIDAGDTVWMEEPGYYGAGSAFVSAGAKLSPLQVSDAGWNLDAAAGRPRADLRDAVLPPSARHHHADGAAAQPDPLGRSLERLDHRGRFRRRVPLPGPAHPGAARHQRVKPRGLCRHLRQDPVSGHAARLPRRARADPRHASSRRSASPASSRRCSPRRHSPTS